MKILLICEAVFPENKGGLERWMTWLGKQLSDRGYEVSYINASGVLGIREGVAYFPVESSNWHYVADGKRSIKQSIVFAFSIRPLIRKIQPDVIYSVQAPIFSIFSLAIWPRKKWLLIVEWIEIWSLKYWRSYLGKFSGSIGYCLQLLATKFADVRVVFSKRCLEQLNSKNPKNVLLPGLCMNFESVQIWQFNNRNDVLFLGRFVAEKQPLLALEAVYELRNLGWTGTFHIVGSGPLKSSIEMEISKRLMSGYVNLIENAPQDELEECFARSFALIHPSKREGYGLAMIEAAERGIPTVLIDYPENASVDLGISPEFVSKSDAPEALAELMLKARDNQEAIYSDLGKWAREVLPTMNASRSVDELISVIEKHR
ncbi:RfaG Glycosyltransferase [Candidatus Nanopelagicaceae bacterium]